jgi:hypothetical protein
VRAGVLMVAAMVFSGSAPAWAAGQAQTKAAPAHAARGGHGSKAHGAQGGAALHAHGGKTHAKVGATGGHAQGFAKGKAQHGAVHAETHAVRRPHQPASAATSAPRSVAQKRPVPKPAAVRPVPHRKLVVNAPPPHVHRAIPAPRELPPILS